MIRSSTNDDMVDEGEDVESAGDLIAQAKALGFLAGTLEEVNRTTLKGDQIDHFITFFGTMFSFDHKTGITASTKAFKQLFQMRHFQPRNGAVILEHLLKLRDDFSAQTTATRLEIYRLVRDLIADDKVRDELQHNYGKSSGFMLDLLRQCRNERDPENLLIWFDIQRIFLTGYDMSADVAQEVFKGFSSYFPISLRTSVTPGGITVDQLKGAVRACFSANYMLAESAFDFLLQKLDQGSDSLTVNVKVSHSQESRVGLEKY